MPFEYFGENSDIVKIKKSNIPNGGKGLFATKSIKKGDFICWYFGVLIEASFVENGYYDSDYLLKSPNTNLVIDANDPKSCFGRYINDSLSLQKNNARYEFYDDTTSVGIIATKNIKKSEEIYMSYGADYWLENRRYNLLSNTNKQYVDDY